MFIPPLDALTSHLQPADPADAAIAGIDALAIANTVREPLLVLDERLHVSFANRAFHQHFRLSAEETTGRSLWQVGDGQWNHPELRRLLANVLPARSRFDDFELDHEFGALGRRVLWLNASEIVAPAPHRRCILLAMEDVTARRRAEAEVAERTREVERFATAASHDLQEPLRKIRTYGALLVAECGPLLDEVGRDYVARLTGAASRMQALIDDLLALARASVTTSRARPTELGRVLSDVLADLDVALQESGGVVRVAALPVVHADPVQMRQLFQNLLANAIKFRRPGIPPVIVVEPAAADLPAAHAIVVRDNGIGFDARHAESVFEPFQRLHGRGDYPGNGVGLAVCRRILERHGGSIRAHAVVGEGATFTITIPSVSFVTRAARPPARSSSSGQS